MSPVCELRILALWIAGDYRNPAVYMQYMPDSAISASVGGGWPGCPAAADRAIRHVLHIDGRISIISCALSRQNSQLTYLLLIPAASPARVQYYAKSDYIAPLERVVNLHRRVWCTAVERTTAVLNLLQLY